MRLGPRGLLMLKSSLFALAIWCTSASLQAQAPPAQAAFTFERMHTKVRFENDGSGRREQTLWIKVLDEQAVRQFGEFAFGYQSESEDLALSEVAVQKPDGTIVSTPPSSVQDLSGVPQGMPIYLDVRRKVASIAALRPGDVLRVTGVWTVKKPIAPGQFWFEHSFDDNDAVLDEQLEIDVPADRAVAMKAGAGSPAEDHGGNGAVAGGRRVYHWKTSHREAKAKPDVQQPGDDTPAADVRVSSFRNWDEFARWYTPLASAAPDPAVKAKADALTAGARSEADKVAAIYRFVSTEIRYVSLSFGLGRFAAHPPADVLRTQYGDCKDKAVLLRAMLAAVGVRAVPVLLNTNRSIADDFASPLEFTHMIAVAAPGQSLDGTWMDATLEVAPLGMLGELTRGRRALALPGAGPGAVVVTPVEPAVPGASDISLEGTIDAIGVLDAKGTLAQRGDGELLLRTIVRGMPRTRTKDFVEQLVVEMGLKGEVSEASTSDPADTREAFRITFRLRTKGFLDWAAAKSQMRVGVMTSMPFDTEDARKDLHRLHFASPSVVRVHAAIDLPSGYAASAPQPVNVTRVGIGYSSSYKVDQRRITVERELRLAARDVPAGAFGEYAALVSAIEADTAQKFSVRGNVTGTPAIPADATSDEVYKAGQDAWEADRYEAAVALYKKATELAPKMGDAWIGLGLAYDQLDKHDEAVAAIQKQIDLDPFSKRAYGDLGFVLKNADKKDEAIKAYVRHTELNPLDGDAFGRLGRLYLDTRRYAEAAPILEKASGLSRDAWVSANLVNAYLQLKQPDKARQALDRLMERKPGADLRSYVSWQMAQGGFDLVRADEIARSAEKDLLAEFRDVDAASVTEDAFSRVERLGWAWDALGWIAFQRGNLTEADAYVRAAWQMLGDPDVAFHLGRVCEKRDKLADAMNYYLTAQALDSKPSADLVARVKKLAGGGDLPKMLETARRTANLEHVFVVPGSGAGEAQFVAIVDSSRSAIDVRFVSGDEALKPLAQKPLRSVLLPVLFPTNAPARIPVSLRVRCADRKCGAAVELPNHVTLAAVPR